jgi:hypothetical protein
MEEDSNAAFDAAAGVTITLSCLTLRGKDNSDGSHNRDYDKVTINDDYVHHE